LKLNDLRHLTWKQSAGSIASDGVCLKSEQVIDGKECETYVYISKSFKPAKASRESFDKYYENHRIDNSESPLDFCKRLGWTDELYKMFIFDYLIINRDRHGANLEVFKNGDLFLSPLFDNGMSFVFLYTEPDSDLDTFDNLADLPVNNFIGTRSLPKNLDFIDTRVEFNNLPADLEQQLFTGLDGVLPERYFKKMLTIIEERWENAKKFRAGF
jgi:hypothetical protein